MDKGTGAERQPPGIGSWVEGYRPRRIDDGAWLAVEPFVAACVGRLGVVRSASGLRLLRSLARLAVWAAGEGLPLDVEIVLDPDTVERFVAVGIPDVPARSRATYRATLRRAGPLLTRRAPWEARPVPMARRHVVVPYTSDEVETLRRAALAQSTPGRVRASRALLALGAGAGLDGRWIARVASDDVEVADGVVLVRVGPPAERVVPVLAEWESEVDDLAATAGDEFLVGGRSTARNRAGSLAASLVVANGSPRFSASRLRSTWLVTHLRMGTRLPELARGAGLQGITVLSDLLSEVAPLEDAYAVEMLRGIR